MKRSFSILSFVLLPFMLPDPARTAESPRSLCELQAAAVEGGEAKVHVTGLFKMGMDLGTLEDAACPGKVTWVEMKLRTKKNKEKLRGLLDRSGAAFVLFDGDFYGPDVPDPKLPEAIRKSYHPGWGHLGAFRTKLVVYSIERVKSAPPETSPKAP